MHTFCNNKLDTKIVYNTVFLTLQIVEFQAGEIQLATEESLKGRQILKGKRRGAAPVQVLC